MRWFIEGSDTCQSWNVRERRMGLLLLASESSVIPEAHSSDPSVTMQIRPIKRLTPAERDVPTSFLLSLALCFSWY